jgi:hypothetical protein
MAKGMTKRPVKVSEISSSTFTPGLVPKEEIRTPLNPGMCHVQHHRPFVSLAVEHRLCRGRPDRGALSASLVALLPGCGAADAGGDAVASDQPMPIRVSSRAW